MPWSPGMCERMQVRHTDPVRARGSWMTMALMSVALLLTGCTSAGPQPTKTLADGTAPAPVSSPPAPTTSRPVPPSSSPTTASADAGGAGGGTGSSGAGAGGGRGGGRGSTGGGSGSSGGGSGSGSGGTPKPAVQPCADGNLSVTVAPDPQRSELGRRAFRITFVNTGDTACTLKGYPQVAATGRGAHTPIGQPADPDERYTPKTERLAPGGSKAAMLLADNIDEHGGPYNDGDTDYCGTAAGDGYFISAPASPKVFWVARSGMLACTTEVHWMRVSPVLTP